jgi:cytoskeletal protein CcmA (bactofilin family)
MNPLRLTGALTMLVDLVFLARRDAPELFDFAVSVAAMASVAALGTFGVGALSRRMFGTGVVLIALASGLAAPRTGQALELRIDRDTRVPAGETIAGSLLITGDEVEVEGTVAGDLVVAAERLTLRGTVEGNLYVFAREADLDGTVAGSVHLVAGRARLAGSVGGSLVAAAENLRLAGSARVARDAAVAVHEGELDGTIARDLVLAGDRIGLRGAIGRDLQVLWTRRIELHDGSRVGGDLFVRLPRDGTLERAAGAVVTGEARTERMSRTGGYLAHYAMPHFYAILALKLAAAFVFGLLLHAVAPQLFEVELRGGGRFVRSLLYGLVFAVATPIALVVVALTLVGIPAALLGLFLYVTALYVASILVGAAVGHALLRPGDRSLGTFGRRLLLGLTLVFVASALPFLGPPVGIVVVLLGLGLLVERGQSLRHPRSA